MYNMHGYETTHTTTFLRPSFTSGNNFQISQAVFLPLPASEDTYHNQLMQEWMEGFEIAPRMNHNVSEAFTPTSNASLSSSGEIVYEYKTRAKTTKPVSTLPINFLNPFSPRLLCAKAFGYQILLASRWVENFTSICCVQFTWLSMTQWPVSPDPAQ